MSRISHNLNNLRERLDLTVPQVHAALSLRGVQVAESTVYGWFNGSRGVRNMEHLKALCDVLQTDMNSMTGSEIEIAEGPLDSMVVREMKGLSEQQREALLVFVRSMKGI